MTLQRRNEILYNENYIGQCRIALCDWINYWAINGVETIEDENTREMTRNFIKFSLSNIEAYVNKICFLVIAEPNIIAAEEITDAEIKTAVTHIMATALPFIM